MLKILKYIAFRSVRGTAAQKLLITVVFILAA